MAYSLTSSRFKALVSEKTLDNLVPLNGARFQLTELPVVLEEATVEKREFHYGDVGRPQAIITVVFEDRTWRVYRFKLHPNAIPHYR